MADLNNLPQNPALFEQHDRLVKLTAPLGEDILLPQDYMPLQASSTVSTEMDDEVPELLNWTPRSAKKVGQA